MKKVFSLLALFVLIAGCDDGDLVFEQINFDDVPAARCSTGNLIYKINDSEALLMKIGDNENAVDFINAFPSEPTVPGEPVLITINNTTTQVVYQLYNGDVNASSICSIVRPATPVIVEDWEATSGTIEITTTTNTDTNETEGFEGGEKIVGYQHNVVFRNITFTKSDGTTQLYDEFPFGIYETTVSPLTFSFSNIELDSCDSSNVLFKYSGREGIMLDINPALLDETQLNVPKTGIISQTLNKLTYMRFPANTTLDATFFCGAPSVQPEVTWQGVPGVENVSGVVEVITTSESNGFLHTIRLKNVSFQRGRNTFKLADDYLLGAILTED